MLVITFPLRCTKIKNDKKPGVVAEEKLRPTTSISGKALRAENRVIVLPDPGGPHRTATINDQF